MWGVWQSVSILTEKTYRHGEFESITDFIRHA